MELKVQKTDIYKVPLSLIVEKEGFNVREDYGDLNELAESIIQNGVKVPLQAYKQNGVYVLIDGHRRFRAAKIAEKKTKDKILVPLVTAPKGSNDETRLLDMILTNDGKRLEAYEEAEVYRRLSVIGWKSKDIAKRVGKSESHIQNLLTFNQVDQATKELVKDKKVSATMVVNTIRKEKSVSNAQEKIKKVVKEKGRIKNGQELGIGKKVTTEKLTVLFEVFRDNNDLERAQIINIVKDYMNGLDNLQECVLKLEECIVH